MIATIVSFFKSASTWFSGLFSALGKWKSEILIWLAHRKGKQQGRKDAQFEDMERKLNDIDKVNQALNDDEFLDWVREQQRSGKSTHPGS